MSWLSKWAGWDKHKDALRTVNEILRAAVPTMLRLKAGKIEDWAKRHGVTTDALDELVDILRDDPDDDEDAA